MSATWDRRITRLEDAKQPKVESRPDMTDWTTMERVMWEAQHHGLSPMVRSANENPEPYLPEAGDAQDARDAAILAERAAKAAADALTRDPTNVRAQQTARETREAADKAAQAAEEAKRIAEEAARRPRPPKPAVEPQAVAEDSAPAPEAKPKPKRQRKRREPGQPKPEKRWWEEKAKWRSRGAADYDWEGGVRYECIHEYDPLDADEDYDPLGQDSDY
jgi:outer membrane biosynthesis protein TonB